MVATNSLNINASGVVTYNATTGVFTESVLTQYDVLIAGATNDIVSVSPSSTGYVLTSTGVSSAPTFQIPATSGTVTSVSGTANQVAVATGTTTPVISLIGPYTPSTYTAHTVLLGEGTSSIGTTAVGTTGQVLTGVTGSDPIWASAAVAFSWVDVTSGTQAIAINTGYVTDNATLVTYTLPATAVFGSVIRVVGGTLGAAGWKIAQNAGQQIDFGNMATTVGTGGYLQSTNEYDSVELVAIVGGASTIWEVISSVGNITIV